LQLLIFLLNCICVYPYGRCFQATCAGGWYQGLLILIFPGTELFISRRCKRCYTRATG
jgi:hypothetical protein